MNKLRALWITNTPVYVQDRQGKSSRGGWMQGALAGQKESVNIIVACPVPKELSSEKLDGVTYYYFTYDQFAKKNIHVDEKLVLWFTELFREVLPDIIHIWGTEYVHSAAAVRAASQVNMREKVVVSLQGIVSICAKYAAAGVPKKYCGATNLWQRYYRKGIKWDVEAFRARGDYEKEVLKNVDHVIGRTEWDHAVAMQLNNTVQYHFCNETLRNVFYNGKQWNYDSCEKHTIFITQLALPIKGAHMVFEAVGLLKERYPDIKIYATGENILVKQKRERSGYEQYLIQLLQKYQIEDTIEFLGELSAEQMQEMFLKANVFVSASIIENESNALSEAMITGTPSVASYVGGVTGRICHGKDGLFYPYHEPYMLANNISLVFSQPKLASAISENAKRVAWCRNDRQANSSRLTQIYEKISRITNLQENANVQYDAGITERKTDI